METATRSEISPQRSLAAWLRAVDVRALLIAIVLGGIACLPWWSTLPDRRQEYFFDVTLTSTTAGYTRVSWDTGRGFNEHDSSMQPLHVEMKPATYRYLLPYGRIAGFRFVPIDRAGAVTFTAARVTGPNGRVVREFSAADFSPGPGIAATRRDGDTVAATTVAGDQEPYFGLRVTAPLALTISGRAAWRLVAPILLTALGIGLLFALPARGPLVRGATRLMRWAGARPRRALALIAAAAVAWQCYPVLIDGRSFVSPANGSLMLYGDLPTVPGSKQRVYADGMGSDTGAMLFQHLYYPMLERRALLTDHEWPLWNRSSLCGVPLLGQGQSMAGDPLNWLTILANGASWAWDVRFVLARWLLALGLAIAAWQLTRHFPAAVLTAIGGSFLGFFTYRLDHPANFTLGYAPWLLVAWIALAQATTRRSEYAALGLLLVAHGVEYCSGTVKEAVVLIAMLDLAGVLLLALSAPVRTRLWRTTGAVVVGALFVLLAAPFWISFLDALHHSYTSYDVPHAGQLDWRQLIGLFDDIFYRQNSTDEWVVAPALNFLFLAGVLAWLVSPRRWTGESVALAATAALCIACGFGIVPAHWIEEVPFLGNVNHVGNEFSCALIVLLAPLAALGFKAAVAPAFPDGANSFALGTSQDVGGASKFAPTTGNTMRWVVAAAVLGVLVAGWYWSPERVGMSLFARGYIASLCLALAALALALHWRRTGASRGAWWVACAIALPILLWRFGQYGVSTFNHYVFVPGERVEVHARSPAVRAIDRLATEPVRVIGFGTNLFPGYPAALGWESLYGVDALRNRWYRDLTTAFRLERVWQWDQPDRESDAAALQPARDALNVGYALADPTPKPRTLGSMQRVVQGDLDGYESPTVWPRAFFVDRLARYGTADDFARLVNAGDRLPFAAIEQGEPGVPRLPDDLATRTIRPATAYALTANTTRFAVDAPSAGVVVLTETYYPGDFQVTIDGRRAPYFRVNEAFKGVAIATPGRHVVVMTYWPEHFTLALTMGAIGWVLVFIAVGFVRVDVRRNRKPERPA